MGQTHRISFEPVDIEMEVDEDENILDAAFRQGIHLMHGCREGQCSACKSFLLDGDIQMDRYSTFACNDAEVEEGYVLLCRGHAFSDCTVELLNFDEDELLNAIPIQEVTTQITGLEAVTRDMVSLRLKPVSAQSFDFKPGQYVDIMIPGSDEHRSFSMATTPNGDGGADGVAASADPGEIEFLIKRYPGGRFSSLLEDGGLAVGDELDIVGPYGSSTLKDGHVLPIVCIAGGAGMAPILSILRHLAQTQDTRPVRFYYGARTENDLFYLDEIKELGSRLSDFTFTACLSESLSADFVADGFSTAEGNVTDVVEAAEDQLRSTEVYMCGPPPMVEAALVLTDSHMVPKDQVFFDKFTTAVQE